jgi:hypothetical protein
MTRGVLGVVGLRCSGLYVKSRGGVDGIVETRRCWGRLTKQNLWAKGMGRPRFYFWCNGKGV